MHQVIRQVLFLLRMKTRFFPSALPSEYKRLAK